MIELLKLMYPYLKPYLKIAIWASACSIPLAAIKAYQAYFVKNVIDGVFDPAATTEYALQLAGILIGLAIINYPLRYFHFFGLRMVVDQATCDIRQDIYTKFQHLSAAHYAKTKQGNLLSVMINDTAVFAEAFNHAISIFREPLTAFFLICVALYHDWKLTLIIFVVLPFFVVIFNITGKRIRRYVTKAQEDNAEMTHHGAEGLTGQKIIKAFNLQSYMVKRFNRAQNNFLGHKRKSNSAEEHSHPSVELIAAIAFGVVIVAAYFRAQDDALTVGEFISFIGALAMFMDPVRRYSKANTKLNQARGAGHRIFKLLGEPEEVNTGSVDLLNFNEQIEFRDVTFSYGKGAVVRDFNLTIKKGEKVGLVGLSGSGKSTVISLLLRLYDIEQGQILVDGQNIKDYKLNTLRDQIALVSQDIFLFNDSILENLTAGVAYSDEQIQKALEVSYCSEFIPNLPDGLDTHIGDRGLRLSGGQSQRLTIARAFLRDCPILLFDEATSALDNESERTVQAALDKVSSEKTVVAVAHRLSTIQNYDTIILMKEAKKVEEGTHTQLMEKNGEYKKLYELSM
ncbi:MAG: ATP-binding cassette domain-containing protein [Bacteriovoracaceae bacterium]|nr:ATP-binding cassette domain-containing protein [Bacteriovoracaceae bacterium]